MTMATTTSPSATAAPSSTIGLRAEDGGGAGATDRVSAGFGTIAARASLGLATFLVGLSAGFFFTYQYSVLLGLAEVGDGTYIETFQAINATIRNPAFGVVFFGSVPAVALAIATNWSTMTGWRRMLLAAALPLYLAVVAVTFAGNVPLNEELAEFDNSATGQVASAEAATVRADFEGDWNRLNLIRTGAVVAAFGALAASAVASGSNASRRQPTERR